MFYAMSHHLCAIVFLHQSQTLPSVNLKIDSIATSFVLFQQQEKSGVIPFPMKEKGKKKSLASVNVIYCLVVSLAR